MFFNYRQTPFWLQPLQEHKGFVCCFKQIKSQSSLLSERHQDHFHQLGHHRSCIWSVEFTPKQHQCHLFDKGRERFCCSKKICFLGSYSNLGTCYSSKILHVNSLILQKCTNGYLQVTFCNVKATLEHKMKISKYSGSI